MLQLPRILGKGVLLLQEITKRTTLYHVAHGNFRVVRLLASIFYRYEKYNELKAKLPGNSKNRSDPLENRRPRTWFPHFIAFTSRNC